MVIIALPKPDWSNAKSWLWVELKYVRERAGIRTNYRRYPVGHYQVMVITADVFFACYGIYPHHHITDEQTFSEPDYQKPRGNAQVQFIPLRD